MDRKIKKYVNEVISYLNVDQKTKKRLREDLYTTITEKALDRNIEDVLLEMGKPKELASEFRDEFELEARDVFSFEYKSKYKLFGIPLIHICFNRYSFKKNIAKGIIAMGPVAIGVIPIGAISIGIVSFGAIGLGLVSFAAVSVGLLIAFGSIAIGTSAIGAVAIGYLARGAVAIGHTAIGVEAIGTHTLEGESLSHLEVYEFIKRAHPQLKEWMIRLFSGGK